LQLALSSGTGPFVETTLTLEALAPGERAEITAIVWDSLDPNEAKRLRALGIDEGARVAVAQRGIFGGRDPIALIVGRTTIAIRRVHAHAMQVSRI